MITDREEMLGTGLCFVKTVHQVNLSVAQKIM